MKLGKAGFEADGGPLPRRLIFLPSFYGRESYALGPIRQKLTPISGEPRKLHGVYPAGVGAWSPLPLEFPKAILCEGWWWRSAGDGQIQWC